MTQISRNELKELFKTGAKPSGEDFKAFIDSTLNIKDDALEKPLGADSPLKITAQGAEEKLLDFYTKEIKTWSINQKSGLNISNTGGSKLFIENGSGNVGIGTTSPQAKLQIVGEDATVNIETKELLRFHRPGVSDVKNHNTASIAVGAMEDGVNGKTRLDFKLSGTPNQNNRYGRIPDVDVITMLGNGNLGVGTTNPEGRLHIVHLNQDPNGDCLILGPTDQSNLRLGYNEDYTWIQSHGVKPLAINPGSNNVGIGTTDPEEQLHIKENIKVEGKIYGKMYSNNGKYYLQMQDNRDVCIRDSGTGDTVWCLSRVHEQLKTN